MTNENELKYTDIEMTLYDLNTIKVAGEVGGSPNSFLAKSATNAINLIKQQADELKAAKSLAERQAYEIGQLSAISPQSRILDLINQLEAAKKALQFMTDCHKDWSERAIRWKEKLEASKREVERLRLVLEIEATYCQKHADLLKESDPARSLRHQGRADRLRNSIHPKREESR